MNRTQAVTFNDRLIDGPCRAAWLFLLVAFGPRPAAAAEGTAVTESGEQQPTVLAPFEVNTSRDVGFVAASSLAGGRLAGDLRDTPAAYSVQTSEFIEALQLTDLNEAAQWAVNTGLTLDDGTNELYGSSGTTSSRGVGASDPQRNFFPMRVNVDSYNVDRFDYARGPNAILFGAGSLGGTSNTVTKKAQFNRTGQDVRLTVGSNDNYRATIDSSFALRPDIALRANALWQDKGGWRDNQFDERNGLHLATAWQATQKLRIDAEAEWGHAERNAPISALDDRVSGWDGLTVFPSVRTANPAVAAALLNSQGLAVNPANNLAARAPWMTIAPALNGSEIFNYSGDVYTRGGAENVSVPVGGVMPIGPFMTPNVNNTSLVDALNVPANRLATILDSPAVPEVTKNFFRHLDNSFSTALDTPAFVQSHRIFSTYLNFKASEHVFLEFAGSYLDETRRSDYLSTRNMRDVFIDLVQTLPDGRPNPGYLHPFGEEWHNVRDSRTVVKNFRAAAAYALPRTRFGNFLFNIMGGTMRDTQDTRFHAYSLTGINPDRRFWARASTVNGVTFDPRIRYRYYWTINTPGNRPKPMPGGPMTVNINGVNYTGTVTEVFDTNMLTQMVLQDRDVKYVQSALNWRFWNNRLVVLAAGRHDWIDAALLRPSSDINHPTYLDPKWDGYTPPRLPAGPSNYEQMSADERANYSTPAVDSAVTSYSAGTVFHATPWLSVFGNMAESFNPNTYGTSISGDPSPPRTSEGWDAGVRLTLAGGRIVANFTRYRGSEINETVNNTSQGAQINAIVNANPVGNTSDMNTRGLVLVPTTYGDRRDRETRGYEFEITANVRRGWRVSANLAFPESYQTNSNADTLGYLDAHDATFRQVLTDSGVAIDANDRAVVRTDVVSPSDDASAAANAWNNLQTFRRTRTANAQRLNRQNKVVGNLFADYTIQEGLLKGFRIGGGINHRGREIIGNTGGDLILMPGAASWTTHPNASVYNYVYAKSYTLALATFGYQRRVLGRNVQFNLKIDNVFDYDDVRYYNTILRPPGGDVTASERVSTPNGYNIIDPRRFTLTISTRF